MSKEKEKTFDGTEPVDPEFEFHPERMKILPRNPARVARPEDLHPRNTKVHITLRVDLDVLDYFKAQAAEQSAAPYQTQMNAALREHMQRRQKAPSRLLADEAFIEAVAAKVHARRAQSKPGVRRKSRVAR